MHYVVRIKFCCLQFKQAVYKQTMKLFAELEIKRKEREAKEMHERYEQHWSSLYVNEDLFSSLLRRNRVMTADDCVCKCMVWRLGS